MIRRPLIAANWKMNLGRRDEAVSLVRQLRPRLGNLDGVDVVLCPPLPVLPILHEILRASSIRLGAQNLHWEDSGAHTGEVSPAMMTGICDYVIIGHSERRAMGGLGEEEPAIRRKVRAALRHGLTPILCVGESAADRAAGRTHDVVSGQLFSAFEGLEREIVRPCVLAYEPVWAIGSGRPAMPAEANRTIALSVRGTVAVGFGESVASGMRVLYGGSVSAKNIENFMAMPEIDGALVGGASLEVGFAELVRRAALAS